MPVSLGSAIGGKYSTNFDLLSPLTKGFQIGEQSRQRDEMRAERKRQALQKRDDALLERIQRATVFKDIAPVYEKMATEEVSKIISDVYDLRDSGDVDSYAQALKKLNEASFVNAKYSGLTKAFRESQELYNKGLLSPDDARVFEKIQSGGDIRNSKGLRDEFSGSGVNDDYTVNFRGRKPYDLNKVINTEVDNLKNQLLGSENSKIKNVYEVNKGFPSTRQEAAKIAKQAGVPFIRSAEDIGEDLWQQAEVRQQVIQDYAPELRQKFGGKGGVISQDPDAIEYAHKKFVDTVKKQGTQSAVFKGIPGSKKSSSGSGGGYSYGNNTFNPTVDDTINNLDLYEKAGIISPDQAKGYKTQLSKMTPQQQAARVSELEGKTGQVLSIAGPNKGAYNLIDESGKTHIMDNVTFNYVPKSGGKGGQWFVKGNEKTRRGSTETLVIPVDQKTYGNIISVYPKMTKDDIVELFNKRMRDGGVSNDEFKLVTTPNRPTRTSNSQPAASKWSKNKRK